MKIPDRYNLIKEAKYLLNKIRLKIDSIESRLHDIDAFKLKKFVGTLKKAWNFKFFRED